jgi:predicted Zn-dependent protease
MAEKKQAESSKMTREQLRDMDVQIEFLAGLVRRDPEYVDALQQLGDLYTKRGRSEDGLRVDEILSRLQPNNPVVHYNLACSLSLVGKVEEAAGSLRRSLDLGFRDFHWLARDPDLHALRKHPLFRHIEARIRELKTNAA